MEIKINMKYEKILKSDIDKLIGYFIKYYEELYNEKPHNNEFIDYYCKTLILSVGRESYWILDENEYVGFFALIFNSNLPRWLPSIGKIAEFYIIPEKRRLGYGTNAVSWIKNKFIEYKIETIELEVLNTNEKAYEFWTSFDFLEYKKLLKLDI